RVVAASPPLLPAGRYNSYYIHYDRTVGGTIADQFIQFSGDIVALIVTSIGSPNVLEETDSLFGLAAYTYPVLGGRGLEDGNDVLTLSAADTLQIDSLAVGADFVDGIRVITGVVVPLPASVLGLLAGLGLLWVKRRRPS
ncbi:MAG: PEP-CTERM sorting domain-containing protein, partial [Pseudomonadota bacterium]